MAKRAEDFLDAEGFLDSGPARAAAGTSAESFLDAEEFLGSQQGQTIQAPLPTSDQGRLSSAGSSFVRGLGRTISGLPKGLALVGAPSAEVFKNLDRIDQGKPYFTTPMFGTGLGGGGSYYDEDPYQPLYAAYQRGTPEERRKIREGLIESAEAATKSALFKAGQDIDRWFAENFPTNPEYQNEFWASKVPQALGSATGFLGVALVTRGALGPLGPAGAYVAPAALGSAMNRAQQFEEAINSGADIATALEASELGAIIGTTEAVPIGNLLNRLDRVTGGAIKKYLVRAVKQGTEEAVQEAFTGIMNDAVAANLYDPERGVWTTDRVEEGAVGFTTGALLETLVTLALPGRRRGQAAGEQAGGEQQAPGGPAGVPQGAVPAETLLGEVQAPTPPGVREQARTATPPPTPEDIESPIPTELIQEGKSVLQDVQGEAAASSILEAAGFPPINSEITLTTRDGGQVTGTVVDAFDQNGQQGAKIRYPDGRVVAETFEALRGRVRSPDAGQAQQEVPGGQAQADAGRVDVGDTGGRGARGRGEPERGGLLDGAPAATGEPGQGPGGLAGEPVAGGPARVPVADAATGGDAALTPGGPATDIRTPPDAGEMQAAPRQPIPRREAAQAEDTAVTSSGREVPVRYAVVEAADLVASQTDDGRTNPAYPAELQPRDRSRAVSQQQIQDIAGKLNPRLLERSAKASDGAPIISEDGVVESGNGRVLAIRRAYSQGQAQQYRDYLAQQGYPVEGMSQPVLVRVREGQMSPEERQAFTREANERDTLGMSATERAMADAAALPDRLLELYRGGDIDAAVNRDFVRAFVDQVVARNERAGMIAADGSMSQEAVRRIEGALLAKAYGDANLVASLIESADTNIKAIGGAMLDVAPQWAQMRAEAAAGRIDPSMDQTARLLEAVRLVQQARRERRNVAELVGQRDMLSGDALHPTAEAFLALMFRNVRQWTQPVGREKMAEALRFYLDEAARTTPGLDLLGDAAPAPERILQTARERRYGPEDIQQGDLLAQPAGGAVERPREAGEGRAERDEPAAPAQDGVEAARAGEQGAGAEGAVAPPSVRIEDFTEKSIIVRGLGKDDGARFEGLKAKPLWNAKANGWVFSKKREAEVRGALADLLAPVDAPATEQAPEPSPTAQPGPYAKWRDASPAQRREMLREAGYTDNDQARVLSGIDWNQLTDPVRRALSAVQPARQERPQRDGWRQIGTNARGNPLFEDERGVRSYTEGGVRVTESVGVIPGGGISINKDARGNDFRTEEERSRLLDLYDAAPIGSTVLYKGKVYEKRTSSLWSEQGKIAGESRSSSFFVDAGVRGVPRAPGKAVKPPVDLPKAEASVEPRAATTGPAKTKRPTKKYGRSGAAALNAMAEAAGLTTTPDDSIADGDSRALIEFFDKFYFAGLEGRDMPRPEIHPDDARKAYEAGVKDRKREAQQAAGGAPAAPGQEPGESPIQRSMREGRERAAALTRADLERIPNDLTGAIRWWAPDVPQGRELPGLWQTAIGAMEMAWTRGFTGQQIIDARRGLPDPYKAPRDYVLALWDATHRAPTAPAAKTPADRRDEAQRSIYNRRIEDMDPAELRAYAEQLRTALLTDERTGLGSNRAWLNRTPKAYIAAVDLDSLKWVNDNMGHPAGDQLIEAVGEALRATGIEAYHVSGDEFYAQADNAGELRRAMEQAQAALRRVTIEGNGLVFTGPGFSYGIASTLNEAERGLHEHKARREEAGERAARGERPAGVVEAAQVPEQKRTEGDRAQAAEAGEGQGAERPEPDVAPRPATEAPSSGASQSVTMGPSEEATDGVQGPVSPGDAPAGAADVQPAAPDRGPRRAPAEEGGRGAPAVQRPVRERAEAPERLPEGAVGEGGRGAGAGDADRVPAGRPRAERPAREAARVKGENFTIEPGALAEDRGRVQKARDNIRAIELMRQIEAEGRPATRAEQEQLARYVGWGGLKGAFPDQNGKFEKGLEAVGEKLRELLPETEYATARRSLQYAHYTAENVARTMWAAVQRLGFRGGRVFEPGMGVGNFPGLMPTDLAARTDYHGLELDHTTARIARLLYPRWGVRQDDFTRAPLPKDTYDLVIGNPPFADIPVRSDPAYPQGFLLHDYFFAKSLDAVRPGGLLAFISSAGTMNKIDAAAREYMADRADLVAAIRLPGSAFEQSAGTSVTTDIIILRKRLPDEAAGDRSWTETVEVTLPGKDGRPVKGRVSRYFVDHPEMVLGEEGFFDPLYEGRYAVRAPKGFDLDAALRQALGRLPENVMGEWQDTTDRAEIDFGTAERKEGSFYVGKDGRLMQQREGVGRPVERRGKGVEGGKSLAEIERIKALIPIRDALRAVYAADLADDTANAEKARKRLNESYDAFVKRFGPINKAEFQYRRPTIIQQESARAEAREEARFAGTPWREGDFDATPLVEQGASLAQIARARQEAREKAQKAGQPFDEGSFNPDDMPDVVIERRPNIDPFMDDPESYRLRAIEKYNDETGEAAKGAVFFQNVITRERTPEIKSVHDALLYVLNQKGRLDIAEVARAAGISQSEAIEQLGEGIFRLPGTDNQWVTRDEYLSGNVRRKLRQARAAAARDPSLQRNVDALEAAQPAPLPPSEINANLGMPWIPTEVIEQFGTEALGLGKLRVRYTPALAQWEVTGDTSSAAARSIWGTQDRPAPALIQDALNRQDPRIYREIRVDGRTTRELDTVATEAAQEKVREIKQRFSDWVWSDPGRASTLAELYNEEYNSLVAREYNGDYLTTPGISSNWSWRPHQKRVIARIIQSGNTYMAHSVGAGKTSAMIGAGMEMRRLGLVRKPMYVVPNHMLGQFTKEFYEQYPTARIMVADERRFHTHRRKQFIADVAAEDLDAVIITHSAFGMIPISDEFQDGLIQQQIDQYRELLEDIGKDQESRITRSRLEKQIERLEQRLSGRGQRKRDQVFTFEEMGVDFLFVDEAHLFRKLDFATKMSNVKGISPEGSKASWDLYVKTRYLETVNPGRNLVLASGTPITNTMAELYTVSRYLQPQELRERGLEHFDAWAGAFGDTVTNLEQDAAGGYKPTTRFAKFVNVPELSVMVRQIMDVVTSRQLEQYVTRPKLKGGKRQMHLAEKGEALEAYQADLARRMEAIANRKGPPKPGDDIILSVINDGRHAAIDMRLVDPTLPNDPGSKLNLLVDNVFRIWQETKRQPFHRPEAGGYSAKPVDKGPATQMIFANLGLSGERGFSVPEYIRSELVRRGVPKNEIAYIANYKSHVAKQRLFNDMNEGKVRVLIGSTGTMATGVNAQRRLYALHNLDPLWYPADDEQRNGRILRQGNMNPEVEIHDYSTKGTYDSTMWGMMETKARFIQGFFEGDPSLRDMEDLGEASQYEQAKAITTADPRLIELTELRQQLEKAQRRKAAFEREQYANQQRVAQARDRVRYYQQRIPAIEADIARRQDTSGENFKAVVDGKTYTDRVEVGDLILGRLDTMKGETREYKGHKIGEIGGFDILADVWGREERAAALVIRREGGHETEVRVSGSSRGLVQSLEAVLRGFESDLSDARERLRQAETTIREFEPQIGKEFTGQAEIDRLTEQVRELERALAPKPAAPAGDDGKFALAYHGTPHQFRRFDLSKIGSGEGNLSFGWGIYFADVEEVAEGYRARLARFGPGVQPGTPAYEALLAVERRSGNEQEAYRALIGFARRADASGNAKRADLMRRAAEIVRAGNAAPRGSLMVVDIPDDAVERMLLWDKPLSEQPPVVRAAINDLIDGGFFDPDSVRAIRDFDARGSMIYKMLGMDNQKPGSDQRYPGTKEAAELLRERGVPGLRYFDGTSRAGGEGTMNTVVWDQALLDRISDSMAGGPPAAAETRQRAAAYRLRDDFARDAKKITANLRARLEQLGIAGKVALNLRDRIQAVADGKASEADGRYLNRVIEVALTAPNQTRTLNHEVIHALRDLGLIRDAEWRALSRDAQADTERMGSTRARYGRLGLSDDALIEEAVADMYADWADGRTQTGGFVRRAFERIRDFLQALGRALTGRGYHTMESVFRAIERGDVGRREQPRDEMGRFASPDDPRFAAGVRQEEGLRGGGKTVTVYHGTSETSLDRILRQGLTPTKRKNHPQSDDFVYLEKSAKAARSWGHQANAQRVAVLEIEIPEEILKRDGKTLSGSSFKTGSIPSAWIKGWDIYHLNARTGELEFVRSENNPGFNPASPDDPRFAARPRQTETPEFRRWFGDSKVVDDHGRPLVVYHGTPGAAPESFRPDADGAIYFTSNADLASSYAFGRGLNTAPQGGSIAPVYLSLQNPLVIDAQGKRHDNIPVPWAEWKPKSFGRLPPGAVSIRDAVVRAREDGHDGLIVKNVIDTPHPDDRERSTVYVAFGPNQVKSAIGNRGTFDPSSPDIRYALADPRAVDPTAKGGAQARQKAANRWYGTQPLDMAMRLPFHIFGGIDERGQWKWGAALSQKAGNLITNAKFSEEGRFAWLNPALEKARAGLLDRYGLDPQYVERERQRGLDERRIMAKVPEIMQRLAEAKIGTAEAKVLQAVLTGEAVADEDMAKLAEPIRNAIDDMGAEAVQLGLISAEAFERNRGAYLHRVYLKHEADQGGLVRWVSRVATARRRRIIGNQFKGRGMWIEADEGVLMKRVPGFKEAERGRPQEGEKFRVLDLLDDQETLRGIDPKSQRKVMDRVYLPAGAPVPDSLKGYVDRGVWEVRGTKGNKVVLWRDFTKRERESMGEIVDARYTIAKTYMQMAHDLATGRFFRDIALNEDWSSGTEPRGAWKNAEEYSRFWADPEIEWVKVPDTTIPKSQTKRYGALAGRYVRAEIWRDLAELERMQKAGWWDALLRQWKINKTARSPVVHMNNVMSNAVLMDLADVRLVDLYRGIRSMVRNDEDYQEAVDNGAFGSDMVAMEIRRNTLQPLLEEIQRDMQGGKDTMEARIGILGKVADAIWSRAKSLDRKMVSLYQLEDEVFRMATYMRNRDRGMTPAEAALDARDQFLNYDIRAPWVNAARRTVLPFISYTYRAVPVLARAIMLRPWKIAKYMTIAYAVNALAYMVAGGDEEEERRALRDTEQGRTWFGTPRMVRMPWSDEYGNPVFLDVRRWIPAGDVFDMNQGHGAIAVPAPLQFGGPLMLAGELALNKQAFTGDEIVNDRTDDWWDKSSKIADWAWKSWMPSAAWIPGSWYWEKIGDAATGARDRQGRPYSLATAAASSVGIKLKPHDVQEEFFWKGVEFERIERELKAELKSLARDHDRGRISDAAFERRERRIMEKMDRLGQERERTFNPR